MLAWHLGLASVAGSVQDGHLPLGGPYPTSDGYIAMIGAFRPNPLRDLCAVLGIADLSRDPRFWTTAQAIEHGPELKEIIGAAFNKKPSAERLRPTEEIDFLCSPLYAIEDLRVSGVIR